jgi:putative tryptophan/tyrosine transport system substrate-binding protein
VQALAVSPYARLGISLPKVLRLALARRSAYQVDRTLKGAKSDALPIEQPTTFDLVRNMKKAGSLSIVLPPSMRVQATEEIE